MSESWRVPIDAGDYFGHRQKKLDLADRRPVPRKAADIVGPGIDSGAVRVTNWNDLLALFNGYYSSLRGALNAPTTTEDFIGYTSMDEVLGGVQTLTSLTNDSRYSRTFYRNPADPESITFGAWKLDYDGRLPDTGPIAAILGNNWVNYDNYWEAATYQRLGGVCHIEGFIRSGVVTTGTILFVLPPLFRPGTNKHVVVATADTTNARINILTDGRVITNNAVSASWTSITNISFVVRN